MTPALEPNEAIRLAVLTWLGEHARHERKGGELGRAAYLITHGLELAGYKIVPIEPESRECQKAKEPT